MILSHRRAFLGLGLTGLLAAFPASAADPIKIGLVTALVGPVGARRRGDHPRAHHRDRRDQRQGRRARRRKLELVRRDDEANPAKGVIAARELISRRRWRCCSAASTRRWRWRSCRSRTRRRCPSWIRGPRARRSRATARKHNYVFRVSAVDELVDMAIVQLRAARTIQREEARHDPRQQSLGRVEREGPDGRARREASIEPAGIEKFEGNDVDVVPQLSRLKQAGRRRALPRRQRRPLRAGREVARPHGLEGADRLALGPGRRPLHRARRPERARTCIFVQTYSFFGKQSPVGERVLTALHGEISGHQGPGRRHARGRRRERLRRHASRRARDRERRLDRRRGDPRRLLQDRAATKA